MPSLLGRTTTIVDGGFTPEGSSVGWWPADKIAGLEDGDPVGTWPDQAGSNDATQSTANRKPTYETNEANGEPIVRFTLSGDYAQLDLPNFCSGYTSGEIFIVLKAAADPATTTAGHWMFGTNVNNDLYPFTNGHIYDGWGSTTRHSCGDPTPDLAVFNVYNVQSDANSWIALINNAAFYSTATNTVGFTTTPKIGVGVGGYGFEGDMAELFMYDSILASGDRTTNADGLEAKYATP